MAPRASTQEIVAKATPSKSFFVSMITKDIRLEDCILDLLDNSLDAARRNAPKSGKLTGFKISIVLGLHEFSISDDCGGIPRSEALEYAFNFGHSPQSEHLDHGIGRYGIGMKRAVFKLGDQIHIESEHAGRRFDVSFSVKDWESRPNDWNFPMKDIASKRREGTLVRVGDLNPGVGEVLNSEAFTNGLARTIAKGYVRFLERGVVIMLNSTRIRPSKPKLLSGASIRPALLKSRVGKVTISIRAGQMGRLGESDESLNKSGPEESGWYVLCNDRVVLAADKSDRTGWGTGGTPNWHPQYNGFLGWVEIDAEDPAMLPWSTTKRELDPQNAAYRHALVEMRRLAKQFTTYTNERKRNPDAADRLEADLKPIPLDDVRSSDSLVLPRFGKAPSKWKTIKYSVDVEDFRRAIEKLGEGDLDPSAVGERTFHRFLESDFG